MFRSSTGKIQLNQHKGEYIYGATKQCDICFKIMSRTRKLFRF